MCVAFRIADDDNNEVIADDAEEAVQPLPLLRVARRLRFEDAGGRLRDALEADAGILRQRDAEERARRRAVDMGVGGTYSN